jgi:polyisoprenoid-binding protein YceI
MLKFLAAAAAILALPAGAAPDTYAIDPQHTYPSIEFPHMGISVWRGKFDKSHGTITLDRAAKSGTVEVSVDPASIDFGLAAMNDKARSEDFFDTAKFPDAGFKGTIKFAGDVPKTVEGQITLLGVTRPLTLSINSFNCITHPLYKKEVCGADAEGELNWGDYGMKASEYAKGDAGRVHLRIQVEALKQ